VLYYDEASRRQLCRERASHLAEEFRRARRLPRSDTEPARPRSLSFLRSASRAPAYRQ
jgi:hypothetical protein